MKKLVQASACLVLAIAASYLVWDTTNAVQPLTQPRDVTKTILPVRPAIQPKAKLVQQAPMLAMQVELGD